MNNIYCPNCKSKNVIKKGKRKTKYNIKQVFYCKDCTKHFTNKKMYNITYPEKVVINAINYYNKGYTLKESSCLVNRRFKVKTSKSSVQRWIFNYSDICSFKNIRKQVFTEFKKDEILFTKILNHRGLKYIFKYHKAKLQKYSILYPQLSKYIKSLEENCPDKVFQDGLRCSQVFIKNIDVKKSCKKNQAVRLCKLAFLAAGNNRERHDILEEFMLINDTATVACELPVWFWDKKLNIGISGHIDILQIRSGKIHILDLKPDARHENFEKVVSQLYLYAKALSYRTGINLKSFRCAWFDEKDYFEFSPSELKNKKFI